MGNSLNNSTIAFPVAFVYMTNRTQVAYQKVFTNIEKIVGKKVVFKRVVSDMEWAILNSITAHTPDAKIEYCLVHVYR